MAKKLSTLSRQCLLKLFTPISFPGMALWMEWDFGGGEKLSSGPIFPSMAGQEVEWDRHSKQGVHLFVKKAEIEAESVNCSVTFDPAEGDVHFAFTLK